MKNTVKLVVICLAGIISTVKALPVQPDNSQKDFRSEKDLRIFSLGQSIVDGRCEQTIKVTFPGGPTVDPIKSDCFKKFSGFGIGTEYQIDNILYSNNPQSVVVIRAGRCVKYFNNNGAIGGPTTLNEEACKKVKNALAQNFPEGDSDSRRMFTRDGIPQQSVGPFTVIRAHLLNFLNKINPSNISG